jgi:hypothetical protein
LEEKSSGKKKNTNQIDTKNNNRKKSYLVFVLIIIIIAITAIGIFWFVTSSDDVIKAQLIVEFGSVQIKHQGGEWQQAENGVLLKQSDAIKTGNNSSASVILFESSIIRLDNSTEIKLEQIIHLAEETNVMIRQESGRTWNTILKISGIDSYEVQTPTTVASVRGTTFYVEILENKTNVVGVIHGNVTVSRIIDGEIIEGIDLTEDEMVFIDPTKMMEPLVSRPLVLEDWMLQNIEKDTEFIGEVQGDLWERILPYVDELKEKFGITEEELHALLEGYLLGYYDLPPETPEWVRDIIELN